MTEKHNEGGPLRGTMFLKNVNKIHYMQYCATELAYCILDVMFINSILIRSNKIQQCAGIYLLQNYSTCSGCSSHPSSGVHKNLTAASGTGRIMYPGNNLPTAWPN